MSKIITNGLQTSNAIDRNTNIVYQSVNFPSTIKSNNNGSFTMKANYLNVYSSSVISLAQKYLKNGLFAVGYPQTFDIINGDTNQTITLNNNIPSNWVNPDTSSNYILVSTYQDVNQAPVNIIPSSIGIVEVLPPPKPAVIVSNNPATSGAETNIIYFVLALGVGYIGYRYYK